MPVSHFLSTAGSPILHAGVVLTYRRQHVLTTKQLSGSNTSGLDQTVPTYVAMYTKKKGSRRSVRVISSPVDWASWEVKLFICSQLWLRLSAVHVCTNICILYLDSSCLFPSEPDHWVGWKCRNWQCLKEKGKKKGEIWSCNSNSWWKYNLEGRTAALCSACSRE